jgi:hypothetical protein
MVIQDVGSSLVIPLELAGCMIHFKHRLPTTEEVNSLKQYCLTQGDTPRNLSSFSDQVADKCYQQAIDNEQKNNLNAKSDDLLMSKLTWLNKTFLSCHTLIHLMLMIKVSKENM